MATSEDHNTARDINLLAHFLADAHTTSLDPNYEVETVVICASSVLHGAETIFRHLQDGSLTAKTLVLCGGIGHSTQLIWDAVADHPEYFVLASDVRGRPEARVLEMILERFFDVQKIRERGCRVLVEDRSTNCGANARETSKVLAAAAADCNFVPQEILVVQDPTMALRTRASFEKVYENLTSSLRLISFPSFVPSVQTSEDHQYASPQGTRSMKPRLEFSVPGVPSSRLWGMNRFVELIMGEIPRLRDDEDGYGPNGRGFIIHVDIPEAIEDAWERLRVSFGASR